MLICSPRDFLLSKDSLGPPFKSVRMVILSMFSGVGLNSSPFAVFTELL